MYYIVVHTHNCIYIVFKRNKPLLKESFEAIGRTDSDSSSLRLRVFAAAALAVSNGFLLHGFCRGSVVATMGPRWEGNSRATTPPKSCPLS